MLKEFAPDFFANFLLSLLLFWLRELRTVSRATIRTRRRGHDCRRRTVGGTAPFVRQRIL